MKKLFYLLIAVVLITCKTNEPKVLTITANDRVRIEGLESKSSAQMVKSENKTHLTPIEVVKQADIMPLMYLEKGTGVYRIGIAGWYEKDTISENPAFLRLASDVIDLDGTLQTEFITAYDIVFAKHDGHVTIGDTIAYIPNAQMRDAEIAIRQAYANQDEIIYELFRNAFKFTPITGEEWRALKAKNKQ